MTPKKIIFLNFYSGHANRGAETFVHELANHLSSENHVYVFQQGRKSESAKYHVVNRSVNMPKTWPNNPYPVTHPLRRLFLDYYHLKELLFTLKCIPDIFKIKPDVIIPLNGGWQSLLCSLIARLIGSCLVIVGQSGPGWDDRWNLFVKPHLFIALTKRQQDWAIKHNPWNVEIINIPNGVDTNIFSPHKSTISLKLQKPIIISVAATIPSKRVEETIRAVAKLSQGSLLLLGTGELNNQIDKLGEELLGQDRYLHPQAEYRQMPEYYRTADLFTLCSDSSEAFGIVYLEAMASGLACVATDDLSRREIVGSAGIYVKDPTSVDQYVSALEKALSENWGDRPQKQAEMFSWNIVADQYQQLINSI